jgi:hypothetical protein
MEIRPQVGYRCGLRSRNLCSSVAASRSADVFVASSIENFNFVPQVKRNCAYWLTKEGFTGKGERVDENVIIKSAGNAARCVYIATSARANKKRSRETRACDCWT